MLKFKKPNSVGLLGSSPDTVLHLGDEELRYELRESMVQQNSSNLHKDVKIAQLHQQMHFYMLTLSGRFRVGFGEGDISNTIEH